MKEMLGSGDVVVVIKIDYLCIASRGVQDVSSSTITSSCHGKFLDSIFRDEFLKYVYGGKK